MIKLQRTDQRYPTDMSHITFVIMGYPVSGYVVLDSEVCNFGIKSASILLMAVRWEAEIIFTKETSVSIPIIIPCIPPWVSVPYVAVVASIVRLS